MASYDAIVLAGGAGRRLGGIDKPSAFVGGRTLLELALDAVPQARRIVVVGPRRPVAVPVQWTSETPAGGGPAAALGAGLRLVSSANVVLLASDLPFARTAVPRLLAALARDDDLHGALLVDATGRQQPLLGAYRAAALANAVAGAGELHGLPVRVLFRALRLAEIPALGGEALDCDTPHALARARAIVTGQAPGAGSRPGPDE